MHNPYQAYSHKVMEKLLGNERQKLISSLEKDLAKRLSTIKQNDTYWTEVDAIIQDLRAVGYDLWNHSHDTVTALWGSNYMKSQQTSPLQIKFIFKKGVCVSWQPNQS